jgi:hypothetical protein
MTNKSLISAVFLFLSFAEFSQTYITKVTIVNVENQ